jgi:hypothetical protein
MSPVDDDARTQVTAAPSDGFGRETRSKLAAGELH